MRKKYEDEPDLLAIYEPSILEMIRVYEDNLSVVAKDCININYRNAIAKRLAESNERYCQRMDARAQTYDNSNIERVKALEDIERVLNENPVITNPLQIGDTVIGEINFDLSENIDLKTN